MLRKYQLDASLERVLAATRLRAPQREALLKVHELIAGLDGPLSELSREDVRERVLDSYPLFEFGADFPHVSFDIATGVGKTRLMGAIAAYLFLAGEASNFLLLAPRRAILRKLITESVPGGSKYLFVDESLIPEARVWHSGNIESFQAQKNELFAPEGPNLFIFSPQALTGGDRRISRRPEFSSVSMLEHLRQVSDLIALVDESHHFGSTAEADAQAWTEAVRSVEPRLWFGMSATVDQEAGGNVLYSYPLSTCLKEGRYTKDVRLIVRQRTEADRVSDEDWDHLTLDFALSRLTAKEAALAEYGGSTPLPPTKPVLLVAAQDTAHAEEVGSWLRETRGFRADEVHVTHSRKSKTDEELERLLSIEDPENPIRVVVNVFELTEGWDVTNVFVVAPLRATSTYRGAIQTMGRGLRLPAGRRVGDTEIDTLDVLCFGKERLQDILHEATEEFGDSEDQESYIEVSEHDSSSLGEPEPTHELTVAAVEPKSLRIPSVRQRPAEVDLSFELKGLEKRLSRSAYQVGLTALSTVERAGSLQYEPQVFVRLVAGRVVSGLRYLTEPLHRSRIEAMVQALLSELDLADELVPLDWAFVAEVFKEEIDTRYRRLEVRYDALPSQHLDVTFDDFAVRVPQRHTAPVQLASVEDWTPELRRVPVSLAWTRSAHEAARFDSRGEVHLARLLDQSPDVEWWARNDPARFALQTPIGGYEPDFLARLPGPEFRVLIAEVKWGDLWAPLDSDARLKARAADVWSGMVNGTEEEVVVEHFVILDEDVMNADSLQDVRDWALTP